MRIISTRPNGRTIRSNASILSVVPVTSMMIDFFEQQASNFANTGLQPLLVQGCRDTLEAFASKMTWHGSSEHGIYGVTNYPWLPKMVLSEAFTAANQASGGSLALLQAGLTKSAGASLALNMADDSAMASLTAGTTVFAGRLMPAAMCGTAPKRESSGRTTRSSSPQTSSTARGCQGMPAAVQASVQV